MNVIQKDVDGKRRVIIDWAGWLDTSEIASSAWTVPTGLTESDGSDTATTAINYFSGGVEGQSYDIKCCITTNDSPTRVKCFTFTLNVEVAC